MKYLKLFEEIDFNDDDWEWEENEPFDKEIHIGDYLIAKCNNEYLHTTNLWTGVVTRIRNGVVTLHGSHDSQSYTVKADRFVKGYKVDGNGLEVGDYFIYDKRLFVVSEKTESSFRARGKESLMVFKSDVNNFIKIYDIGELNIPKNRMVESMDIDFDDWDFEEEEPISRKKPKGMPKDFHRFLTTNNYYEDWIKSFKNYIDFYYSRTKSSMNMEEFFKKFPKEMWFSEIIKEKRKIQIVKNRAKNTGVKNKKWLEFNESIDFDNIDWEDEEETCDHDWVEKTKMSYPYPKMKYCKTEHYKQCKKCGKKMSELTENIDFNEDDWEWEEEEPNEHFLGRYGSDIYLIMSVEKLEKKKYRYILYNDYKYTDGDIFRQLNNDEKKQILDNNTKIDLLNTPNKYLNELPEEIRNKISFDKPNLPS